jgi:hypothetical protein
MAGPNICAFCDAAADSDEHLWGDWLNRVLPTYENTTYNIAIGPTTRAWNSPRPATLKIKAVCGPCNNEWMSRLESAVKPIIVPMIYGQRVKLSPDDQKIIATWALKTTMVGEQLSEGAATIPKARRESLRLTGEPPMDVRVFTAANNGRSSHDTLFHYNTMVATEGEHSGSLIGHAATISIRHLTLQVLTPIDLDQPVFTYKAPFDAALGQIWPTVGVVEWPPGGVLAPDALEALTNHWNAPNTGV